MYSIGSKPLQIWDKTVRNGHIKRITDQDIQSLVIDIASTNVRYITAAARARVLRVAPLRFCQKKTRSPASTPPRPHPGANV